MQNKCFIFSFYALNFNLPCLSALSLEYDENKSIVFRPSGKVNLWHQNRELVGLSCDINEIIVHLLLAGEHRWPGAAWLVYQSDCSDIWDSGALTRT